jgi:hypothetical protein
MCDSNRLCDNNRMCDNNRIGCVITIG